MPRTGGRRRQRRLRRSHYRPQSAPAEDLGRPATPEEVKDLFDRPGVARWEGRESLDYPTLGTPKDTPWHAHPTTFELSALILLVVLMIWWW